MVEMHRPNRISFETDSRTLSRLFDLSDRLDTDVNKLMNEAVRAFLANAQEVNGNEHRADRRRGPKA